MIYSYASAPFVGARVAGSIGLNYSGSALDVSGHSGTLAVVATVSTSSTAGATDKVALRVQYNSVDTHNDAGWTDAPSGSFLLNTTGSTQVVAFVSSSVGPYIRLRGTVTGTFLIGGTVVSGDIDASGVRVVSLLPKTATSATSFTSSNFEVTGSALGAQYLIGVRVVDGSAGTGSLSIEVETSDGLTSLGTLSGYNSGSLAQFADETSGPREYRIRADKDVGAIAYAVDAIALPPPVPASPELPLLLPWHLPGMAWRKPR